MAPEYRDSIARFACRVFLWLPPCFGAWYFTTILIAVVLAGMLDVLMAGLLPGLVEGVVPQGNDLMVLLHVEALPLALRPVTPTPVVSHAVDAVKFGYGMPLYTALLLASPGGESEKAGRWMLGIAILLMTQCLSLSIDILKTLVFALESAREELGFSDLGHEALAFAHHFGYLILPAVTPVIIWGVQFRRYIARLTSQTP